MEYEHDMVRAENSRREYIKFGAIIALIFVLSWLLTGNEAGFTDWMRSFMGVFFVVFALFKFIGYEMFTVMFAGYDIVAKRFKPYAYFYPFVELGLGISYLLDLYSGTRDFLTLIVMAVGSVGVIQEIQYRRSGVYCACLGNVIKLPLSTVSLVEDVGMGLMAAIMLLA